MARRAVSTLAADLMAHGVRFARARVAGPLDDRPTDVDPPRRRRRDARRPLRVRVRRLVARGVSRVARWRDQADAAGRDLLRHTRGRRPFRPRAHAGMGRLSGRHLRRARSRGPWRQGRHRSAWPGSSTRTRRTGCPTRTASRGTRAWLARRFPRLPTRPSSRAACARYENTSTGDFLIDRHPDHANVLIVGGGSGHGFKHGPAVGEYVARIVAADAPIHGRFSLAAKTTIPRRAVY